MNEFLGSRIYIVVVGYCHQLFNDSLIIPSDVIKLCCLYWSKSFKIFIHEIESFSSSSTLHLFHIETKKLSQFNGMYIDILSRPFCYIPCISKQLNILSPNRLDLNRKKSYDGIICIQPGPSTNFNQMIHDFTASGYLTMLLFESNSIYNNNIKYNLFKSSEPLPIDHYEYVGFNNTKKIHQFIYCDHQNGIIYQNDGYLYQLKLQNIDLRNKRFEFDKLSNSKIIYKSHPNLTYLHEQQKIFSIHNETTIVQDTSSNSNSHQSLNDLDSFLRTMHTSYLKKCECAIFDMENEQNWKQIANLEYNATNINRMYLQNQICENVYDKDVIYVITSDGCTATYNFEKNKWYTSITNGHSFTSSFNVWMDTPHILCCGNCNYFGSLDLRDDKPKWLPLNEMNKSLEKFYSKNIETLVV